MYSQGGRDEVFGPVEDGLLDNARDKYLEWPQQQTQ